jgi:hypothetical protein
MAPLQILLVMFGPAVVLATVGALALMSSQSARS